MYILNYLSDEYAGRLGEERTAEYRLLCSGELYSGRVATFDWRKSDATRFLLRKPFSLTVVSQPFDDYPQELSLVITVPFVKEESGKSSSLFHPDDDIAEDIVALLTVFLRRLVTVCVKVRTKNLANTPEVIGERPEFSDWPLPVVNAMNKVAWKRRGISIAYSMKETKVIDHSPAPVPIDPRQLESKFASLPTIQHGEAFVLAARLYAQAMRMIEESPEISYQLLVYSVETIANKALSDFSPTSSEQVQVKEHVARRAEELGLQRPSAEELAVLACKGMDWAARKFRKFIQDYTDDKLWQSDELFPYSDFYKPPRAEFEKTLKQIYQSRSSMARRGTIGADRSSRDWTNNPGASIPGTSEREPKNCPRRLVRTGCQHFPQSIPGSRCRAGEEKREHVDFKDTGRL